MGRSNRRRMIRLTFFPLLQSEVSCRKFRAEVEPRDPELVSYLTHEMLRPGKVRGIDQCLCV